MPDISASMERSQAERRFRALFDTHRRLVLAYALRRVDEPADAADVVAETFLVAWRRLGDVPEGDAARGWLLGVARRALANQRRGERRRDGLADRLAHELTATPPVEYELDERVRVALARLSAEDRELLLLAGWDGLTPREIAVATGTLAVTVRSRLHRARRRLRAELTALGWEGDSGTLRTAPQEKVA
jgi:RNA polymerase sigma-70 factor (ECF subfamily)